MNQTGPPQPAHVHRSTCDDLDPTPLPPPDVEDGGSEATVDVTLDELTSGEDAVDVHESAEEVEVYVACGEIEG